MPERDADLCPITQRSARPGELAARLVDEARPPADRDPVAVYLARLNSPKSRRAMTAALRAIAAELGAVDPRMLPWARLRYPHVLALRARFVARYAPATVNQYLAALRGVVDEARLLGVLSGEDAALIKGVKNVRGSRTIAGRHIERSELQALLATCDASTAGARDAAMIAVLRLGGLRRAELVALDVEDLDVSTFALRVLGKGNKERLVYVGVGRAELECWLARRGREAGPLFCAVDKADQLRRTRLAESSVTCILQRAIARAHIAHASPHDFRRTFVGDLLDAKADIAVVKKLAGHADIRTTERYDRRDERAAAATAHLLDLPRK